VDVVGWQEVVGVVVWDIIGAWSICKWGIVDVFHYCWKINVLRGLVVVRVVAIAECDVSAYAGVISKCAGVRFRNRVLAGFWIISRLFVGGWFAERFRRVWRTNPPPSPNCEVSHEAEGGTQSRKRGGMQILLLVEREKT
jgi:hypothetical protein